MSDRILSPWAIYDPSNRLAYLGLHATHIEAWLGYLGGVLPFGAIMSKTNDGWRAERVEVRAITNVVPLRPEWPERPAVERDTLEVGAAMGVELGEYSKEIV